MPKELMELLEKIDAERAEDERKREVLLEESRRKYWEEQRNDPRAIL